jgi:putative FmdB family regulatory protein
MPTYEYICRACGHEFEEFQSIKADPIAVCPKCRKRKVERQIGTGGAVIFKGGGFYETDYRSESYRSGADAEKKAGEAKPDAAGTSKPETKAESRAESKAESKADPKPAPKPEPKPDAAAAAAENKRIEARATHQSRIGRGVGNIVKKNAALKKKR